jgi:Protein of unknown function (DUF3500)
MFSRLILALSLLAVYALGVLAQQPPAKRPPEELLRLSLAAEKPGLAEPFTGVTTNGRIESGLFTVRSSGVSTAAVATAAETFLAGLTPEQRKKTVYLVDDPEWRKWMNQSFVITRGTSRARTS